MGEIALIPVAFLTSAMAGVIGLGGGVLLFSVMSIYFPPLTLVPMHGIVQLASNFSRAAFASREIRWKVFWPNAFGVAIGAAVGSQVVVALPERLLGLLLGGFILLMIWAPVPRQIHHFRGKFFVAGILNSFISLFVGATGPFLAAFFVHEGMDRKTLVATQAACQALMHAAKLVVFFAIGFAAGPYLGLLAGMVAASFAGSWAAGYLLGKMPERAFQAAFKGVVTLLAIRMIAKAI